jgi:uncharacterized LabA/DUF88 family protein
LSGRWMVFIDGENLTSRGEQLASLEGLSLTRGPFYEPGVFVWMPTVSPAVIHHVLASQEQDWQWVRELDENGTRAHYYTTAVGSEDVRDAHRGALWNLGFSPYVFKKEKSTSKTKGVDVTLTKDVLSHAFQDNYDAAFLVAGDGDYVPLVEEVKRRGKIVYVAFFDGNPTLGMSSDLRLASDRFISLNKTFVATWSARQT